MDDEDLTNDSLGDYQEYVRLRSLNRILVVLAPYAGALMIVGAVVMAAGYVLQPDAEVVGVDPAGRAWALNFVDQAGHAVQKGSRGE
ncbi:hypothetical protein [Duganella sp. LjRoot269]|uniref:hypothetical protein n=1 Tax=Duganella sp. LjRoot269 TaxID=3342305 RepID=UPI003ECC2349